MRLWWLAVLVGLQAGLVGVYWLVEQNRKASPESTLGTAPPQSAAGAFPALRVSSPKGPTTLSVESGPRLIHVWATWCPPCKQELPGLLELAKSEGIELTLLALDQDWGEVDAFLAQLDTWPSAPHLEPLISVVLASSTEVEAELGVHRLPVTFLLDVEGQLISRFDGPRDWTAIDRSKGWLAAPQTGAPHE